MEIPIATNDWKNIVKGVICTVVTTIMITTQTSVVKYGGTLGYLSSVVVTFRGIVQLIFCLIESTISINKTTKKRECNIFRIITDIKSIGIIPRRTHIPLFSHHSLSSLYSEWDSSRSLLSTNSDDPITPIASEPITPISNQDGTLPGFIQVIDKPITPVVSSTTPAVATTKAISFHKKKRRTKNYRYLIWSTVIMRGFIGGIACLLSFEASMLLPVGDYSALLAMAATITPLFAFIIFKDKLSKLHSVSLIGAVVGVVLIVQPPFIFNSKESIDKKTLNGYIYAFGVCVCQSGIYVCIQFARKVPIYILTLSQSIWSIITGITVLLINKQLTNTLWIDNWLDLAFALMVGLAGYIYLVFLTASGRYLPSGVVALLLNLSIVWGYAVQIVFFDEMPGFITLIGAVCMFLSAVIVSIDKVTDAKKKSQSMSIIDRNAITNVGAI